MKLKIFFLLCCVGSLQAAGYSQVQHFSIQKANVSLVELMNEIQRSSEYRFFYQKGIFNQAEPVSVDVKDVSLKQILDEVLMKRGFSYEIMDKIVTIRPNQQQTAKNMVFAGLVTDVKKQPLPGVTVMIKGTTIGTVTNNEGRYTFVIPQMEQVVLTFSFVGMKTKEVRYDKQNQINVVLEEEAAELDEVSVVATGYQTVNRKDMVGSFTTVKVDDIINTMPSFSRIDQLLQGQVPGMIVTQTSSRAGTSPKIQIRGTSTLLGNQDPIWVVDGIIQDDPISLNASTDLTQDMKNILGNQISWLNPNDIETITVLKDASATAVYGSRASNGVIVITTKKGKVGRLSVTYSTNISISPASKYSQFKLMNSQERIQFSENAYMAGLHYLKEPLKQKYTYEGLLNMYQTNGITADEFVYNRNRLETINTDWLDLLTQTAVSHNHNLSVTGATEKLNYTVSAGYAKTPGQEIGNADERFTTRTSLSLNLLENIKVTLAMNGAIGNTTGFAGINPLEYALTTSRAIPAFNEDGTYAFYRQPITYNYNKETEAKGIGFNILNERENSGSKVKSGRYSVNLNFSWKLLDWLEYQFAGGYSYSSVNSRSYQGERTTAIAKTYRGYDYGSISPDNPWFTAALLPFGGELFTSAATTTSYNVQNKLLFSKQFNENHRLNAMLALEVRSTNNINDMNNRWGYIPDRGNMFVAPTAQDKFKPIGSGARNLSGLGLFDKLYSGGGGRSSVEEKTDNFMSYFATLAYSLKSRYVFNFNVRNDVSNRFGQNINNRFDPTYSFGVSWRVTDEPFMQHQKVLTALNMKATWGIQGNALLNKSPELILMQQGVAKVYNEYYSTISSIPNPNLSWERTHNWNFGMDMQLFGKVNVNVDYYIRRSNAILSQDIPFENGKSRMEINGGIINNKGVEVTVALTPVNTKNFGINLSINSSKNWNKTGANPKQREVTLVDYINGTKQILVKEGYPLGARWSFAFDGLNPENGWPLFKYLETSEENPYNGDMTSFLVYSGQQDPFFTGGLNLNIRYHSFTLGTSFSLLLGGNKRMESPYKKLNNARYMPDEYTNVTTDLLRRWQKPGDEKFTNIPGFIQTAGYIKTLPNNVTKDIMEIYEQSDELLVNKSFLRCRGLNLSWRLSNENAKRMGLSTLSVNAAVTNLFVIASKRFNGYDPELEDSVMPRNYTLGLSIGF